ncbi:MAG TPA: sugar MFS transporter [Steroidobacteraceae bacterium]|jgi:FHS family L-fucose permease-like MFS transporter|nr:sugar MFS transporter [Steroidobacteraceae bacterium]
MSVQQNAGASGANAGQDESSLRTLRLFVFGLFFMFGGITSLNDVIIPKLKALFTLNYAQVMLVQFAFFIAYFLISIPGAAIVARIGYMRTAAIGLLTMTAGCLLFIPASSSGLFIAFLGAIFVLGSGITIVQVVANPLISMLGRPQTVHSRLTFAQAFNSLGTTVFPYVGSILILGSLSQVDPTKLAGGALAAFRTQETQVIVYTYLGLATALLLIAALVWLARNKLVETPSEMPTLQHYLSLLKIPRFSYGTLCIFLYVGGEVAIGSLIVNYLMQSNVFGIGPEAAGKLVNRYWGGAMVGRFIGSYLLRIFSPGKVLSVAAAANIVLLLVSANTSGAVSGWSLLAIGLFNSIMFPTIFSLACEGLGPRAAEASGIICVAIVGGAIVPLITGRTADLTTLKTALFVPAICYAVICGFGIFARRPAAYAKT